MNRKLRPSQQMMLQNAMWLGVVGKAVRVKGDSDQYGDRLDSTWLAEQVKTLLHHKMPEGNKTHGAVMAVAAALARGARREELDELTRNVRKAAWSENQNKSLIAVV